MSKLNVAPRITKLEITESARDFLELMAAQLTTHDHAGKRLAVNPKVAFPVCLSLAQGDAEKAGALYADLTNVLSDWQKVSNSGSLKAMPFL